MASHHIIHRGRRFLSLFLLMLSIFQILHAAPIPLEPAHRQSLQVRQGGGAPTKEPNLDQDLDSEMVHDIRQRISQQLHDVSEQNGIVLAGQDLLEGLADRYATLNTQRDKERFSFIDLSDQTVEEVLGRRVPNGPHEGQDYYTFERRTKFAPSLAAAIGDYVGTQSKVTIFGGTQPDRDGLYARYIESRLKQAVSANPDLLVLNLRDFAQDDSAKNIDAVLKADGRWVSWAQAQKDPEIQRRAGRKIAGYTPPGQELGTQPGDVPRVTVDDTAKQKGTNQVETLPISTKPKPEQRRPAPSDLKKGGGKGGHR